MNSTYDKLTPCCGNYRVATIIGDDATMSMCDSCEKWYVDPAKCKCDSASMIEIGAPPRMLSDILSDLRAEQTKLLDSIAKKNFINAPDQEFLEKMSEIIKQSNDMLANLPHCYEKVTLNHRVQKMTTLYRKWYMITNVFQKMGDAEFLQKIEKISKYLDGLTEPANTDSDSLDTLSNCAEVDSMSSN